MKTFIENFFIEKHLDRDEEYDTELHFFREGVATLLQNIIKERFGENVECSIYFRGADEMNPTGDYYMVSFLEGPELLDRRYFVLPCDKEEPVTTLLEQQLTEQ